MFSAVSGSLNQFFASTSVRVKESSFTAENHKKSNCELT